MTSFAKFSLQLFLVCGLLEASLTASVKKKCNIELETDDCIAAGGSPGKYGFLQSYLCNCPAPDAGKPCKGTFDSCAGTCLCDRTPEPAETSEDVDPVDDNDANDDDIEDDDDNNIDNNNNNANNGNDDNIDDDNDDDDNDDDNSMERRDTDPIEKQGDGFIVIVYNGDKPTVNDETKIKDDDNHNMVKETEEREEVVGYCSDYINNYGCFDVVNDGYCVTLCVD